MSDERPFDLPWNTAVLVLRQVFAGEQPIRLVGHDDDGDWQFLDGSDDPRTEDAMIVCLGHVLECDPTVANLADLPRGRIAWRGSPRQPWRRSPRPWDDE